MFVGSPIRFQPRIFTLAALLLAGFGPSFAQQPADPKSRIRAIRDLAKVGDEAVPQIGAYLRDSDLDVRLEAVKTLAEMGGPKVLDPLIAAAADNDSEVQIRATDGLVNVYLPGYVKGGLSGTLRRVGTTIRAKFTETNDQIVDAFVQVRPEAIGALARIARGGASMEARANAARGVGILRGKAAIPELADALRSKDDRLMYESLMALQKIGEPESASRIAFLLKDLDERIQVTALETTGVLRNKEALPEVRDALDHARTDRVRAAAVGALAMIADPADHPRFVSSLADKHDGVRAAGAEGLGRLRNPVDKPVLERTFASERSTTARVAGAFALAKLGSLDLGELAPFRYLINTLNLKVQKGIALAYLVELAREPAVRTAIFSALARANKEERIGLSTVLGRSGEADSLPYLERLSMDPDPDVAAEGIRALRTLRARLP